MSFIYFVRHGQAGSRDNYDVLSEVGQQQARSLGEYFLKQRVEFSGLYAGGMHRQFETARLTREALAGGGMDAPEITSDERWNEFSLISVYRALAKRMMKEDEAFARDIKEMQQAIALDPHTTGGAVGRCDQAVIRAWIEHRYPDFEGETWASFRSRIEVCAADLSSNHRTEKAVAIFTSATPIAITTGIALGLSEEKMLSVLGVIYNTSVTVMRVRNGDLRLFTFNSTPHLSDSQRTFR